MAELSYVEWLTERRNKSHAQNAMLLLLIDEYRPEMEADQVNLGGPAQFLVGILFSLWRAVFLGETKETNEAALDAAKEYLRQVVLTNNIAFLQDVRSSHWTFGYYANNAGFRLQELSKRWPEMFQTLDLPRINKRTDFERYQAAADRALVMLKTALIERRESPVLG